MASKPGVEYTLVLSKADGSIIRSSSHTTGARASAFSASSPGNDFGDEPQKSSTNYDVDTTETTAQKNIEDVARMVFSFISAAGALVEDMDPEDGLKLLRLRTRKNEFVIVPGQLFFFITEIASICLMHLHKTITFEYLYFIPNYCVDAKYLMIAILSAPAA